MKFGAGWDETDPEALELARDVFSAPWAPRWVPGAKASTVQRPPQEKPQENALGESPLRDSSPEESSPKENGSPRAASSGAESMTAFQIDPAEIAAGRLDVAALNRNEAFAQAVLPLLGQTDLNAPAPCCLPGHSGTAAVIRSSDGRYLCCCQCGGKPKPCSLTDAYAAKTSGQWKRRSGSAYFLWTLRMAAHAGCLVPAQVALRPLLVGPRENARKVYEGLAGYLAVRYLTDLPPAFTFTRSFVADWCDLSLDAARTAIETLRKAHIIEKVGETTIGDRAAYLYRVAGSKRALISPRPSSKRSRTGSPPSSSLGNTRTETSPPRSRPGSLNTSLRRSPRSPSASPPARAPCGT